MKLVTTGGKAKPFIWSYSKIKNFETCPKRYYNIDVAKNYSEPESEQLTYGNTVHKVLAEAISGKAPLPETYKSLQKHVDRVTAGGNAAKILVEQDLAVTKDFAPTAYFGDDVWFRVKVDVAKIVGPVAAIVDWKTGKIVEDGIQLAIFAQAIFSHHPQVQKIRTEFVWLQHDAVTRADFSRADMVSVWAGLLPRVQTLEGAHKAMDFPPKPGGLCRRYCAVTSCPHHGE